MSSDIPGAFPGLVAPSNQDKKTDTSRINSNNFSSNNSFQVRAPTSSTFNFTPLSQNSITGSSLYPNLSLISSHSDNNNTNGEHFLSEECHKMGYSNKLSSNVLSELDQRANSKLHSSNAPHAMKSMRSPRSTHGSQSSKRFNRLESISSHYAAIRHQQNHQQKQEHERVPDEDVVEIEKENMPEYDPNSKRAMDSNLTSIAKRRKTEISAKKTMPSQHHGTLPTSRRYNNLGNVSGTSRQPTRAPVRQPIRNTPTSTPFRFNSSSLSTPTSDTATIVTKPVSKTTLSKAKSVHNLSNITDRINNTQNTSNTGKSMTRSSTMKNLTKPTVSSLGKSTSYMNLKDPKPVGIPRPKTTRFAETADTGNSRPVWR